MSGQCPNCGVWLDQRAPRVGDVYLERESGYLYRVTADWSNDEYATVERLYPTPGPSPCAERPMGLKALWKSHLDEGRWIPVPREALPSSNEQGPK